MGKLPAHLFINAAGNLFDTRDSQWSQKRPLRPRYEWQVSRVETLADVKAALRAGGFAWPGGYPLYFITSDGAALSFDGARKAFAQIAREFLDDSRTGWRIVAIETNWEDSDLTCEHTGERIPSAYGDDDAPGEEG